jgi:dTMP kinase
VSAREDLRKALLEGDVICNRYTPSNVAFQAAKLEGDERWNFVRYLEHQEYEILGVPKPDLVIFLDVPLSIALEQLRKRGGEQDQHERNVHYQEEVASVYRQLSVERHPEWVLIECARGNLMRSPEEIHQNVWREYMRLHDEEFVEQLSLIGT